MIDRNGNPVETSVWQVRVEKSQTSRKRWRLLHFKSKTHSAWVSVRCVARDNAHRHRTHKMRGKNWLVMLKAQPAQTRQARLENLEVFMYRPNGQTATLTAFVLCYGTSGAALSLVCKKRLNSFDLAYYNERNVCRHFKLKTPSRLLGLRVPPYYRILKHFRVPSVPVHRCQIIRQCFNWKLIENRKIALIYPNFGYIIQHFVQYVPCNKMNVFRVPVQ